MAGLGIAAVATFLTCLAARRLGPRLGFLDVPDDPTLKAHQRPAIPLGGVGILVGTHLGLLSAGELDWGFLTASVMILAVGLVDDRRGISPLARLVGESAGGVALVVWAQTPLLADLGGVVVGVVVVLVCVNAVNLFDGLDGLAGSAGLVAAIGIAALGAWRGTGTTDGLVLAGALAGFLVLNWHPARLFLGDNGAYLVGLFLAYGVLRTSEAGPSPELVVAMGLLGVFALDLVATVLRRVFTSRDLFTGDRHHMYDLIALRGWSVPAIALWAAIVEAGFVLAVLVVDRTTRPLQSVVILGGLGLAALMLAGRLGFLKGAPP